MRQCSYVAVGFSFAAFSAPASATALAARSLVSLHSFTISSLCFCTLSCLSSLLSSISSFSSPGTRIPCSRKDFLAGSVEVSSLFFRFLYGAAATSIFLQAVAFESISSLEERRPRLRRRALFRSMFLARNRSYSLISEMSLSFMGSFFSSNGLLLGFSSCFDVLALFGGIICRFFALLVLFRVCVGVGSVWRQFWVQTNTKTLRSDDNR
mmetsp:Transcript_37918/g.56750  ORF Transcript_37918/g.56750 Transcript_37918/m.56750 type:complete len:210 (-) Transcript_37918:42-671(-)